jgi:hypothetical protein
VRCAGYNAPVEWYVADCGDPLSPRRPPCGAAASPLPLFEPPGDSALDERGSAGADADAGAPDAGSITAATAQCRKASRAGRVAPPLALANISIGIVTHEAAAFAASLETYEARGLLGLVGEVLVFMNLRSKEMDAALAPFRERWPGLFKVLDAGLTSAGAPENWSMAMALNALVGASTRRFFLLLERDFQLIEPDTCVLEQLGAAAEMISTGAATAVRLRSRHFEGRPNRAAELFRGSEWLAFETRHWGGFPKYACSLYHWLEVRDERALPRLARRALTCTGTRMCMLTRSYSCAPARNATPRADAAPELPGRLQGVRLARRRALLLHNVHVLRLVRLRLRRALCAQSAAADPAACALAHAAAHPPARLSAGRTTPCSSIPSGGAQSTSGPPRGSRRRHGTLRAL